jgi:hypothetical protein
MKKIYKPLSQDTKFNLDKVAEMLKVDLTGTELKSFLRDQRVITYDNKLFPLFEDTGYIILEKKINEGVASTEIYFSVNGIAWIRKLIGNILRSTKPV